MENMRPGNSFPQICVVSVNKSVEKGRVAQDYRRSVALSNLHCWHISNLPLAGWIASAILCS